MLDKQGYMHLRNAHAHAPGHPHARTHTQLFNAYVLTTTKMIRERASMLRYTYIASLVYNVAAQNFLTIK